MNIIPSVSMTFPSLQLGFYLMGFGGYGGGSYYYGNDIGATGGGYIANIVWWGGDLYTRADMFDTSSDRIGIPNTDVKNQLGCIIGNRSSSTNFNLWCNDTKVAQNSTTMSSAGLPTGTMKVFSASSGRRDNKHGCSFTADGMTDGQIQTLSTIVNKYMSNIGRAVKVN